MLIFRNIYLALCCSLFSNLALAEKEQNPVISDLIPGVPNKYLVAAVLSVLVAQVLIPAVKHYLAERRIKKKVLVMMQHDIASRIALMDRGVKSLEMKLENYLDPDNQKDPFLITMGSDSHEVFSMKEDKWHVPSFVFTSAYNFYSAYNDAISIVEAIDGDKFGNLDRETKLKIYQALVSEWRSVADLGRRTLQRSLEEE